MTVKLFVIIVTYKGKQWYDRCFTSLRESSIAVQTVVVDNASNDGTVEYIKEFYPEIHLIESGENLGFGRANNLGMRYALDQGCDYVFLLNQDAWVEKDTFEKMIDIHCQHQEYGVLGCINVTKEKDHMLNGFLPLISDSRNCCPSLVDDMFFSRLKDVYDIKSILASAWLLPRKTLEIIGGFDPIFFHYGEDDNYLQRALYHGMKVGVCPKCPIVHDAQSARVQEAVEYRKDEYAQKRDWMLEWCDVNNPAAMKDQSSYLFWKTIKLILQAEYKKASHFWGMYRFYRQNKDAIMNSLSLNKTLGKHYLN